MPSATSGETRPPRRAVTDGVEIGLPSAAAIRRTARIAVRTRPFDRCPASVFSPLSVLERAVSAGIADGVAFATKGTASAPMSTVADDRFARRSAVDQRDRFGRALVPRVDALAIAWSPKEWSRLRATGSGKRSSAVALSGRCETLSSEA
jgi:hypothetical protein